MDDLEQRRGKDVRCDIVKSESKDANTVHLMPFFNNESQAIWRNDTSIVGPARASLVSNQLYCP
jgi:hypothetical protein